ncbi:MAG: hypothetical protein QM597_06690 [Aeromicrobium sp.]|uniref:hypothetical protein n=1 Tax=Aeromicrobium sp. TaxID=1871063 RepID=UPI0039E306CB
MATLTLGGERRRHDLGSDMRFRHWASAAACGLLLATTGCGGGSGTPAADAKEVSLDPVPSCSSIDIGPVFDGFGGLDPQMPVSNASIGSSRGCEWTPVADDVGLRAKVVVGEHDDLSDEAILEYAQSEWAEATGGEPWPQEDYRPGEHGWSYGMTSTVPIISILESHWLTLVTPDGALRCHFWGFDDPSVAWTACDAIRDAVTTQG